MSEIAELRKLIQDLVAPDLKAIGTDLAAFKAATERQFATMETVAQARYEAILAKLDVIDTKHSANHREILKALDIDRRMERVEAALQSSSSAAA